MEIGMGDGDGGADEVDGGETKESSSCDEDGGRHIKEVDSIGEYEECVEGL